MKKEKKPKKPIVLATRETDIKYRGPLNYQGLRIFGWIFMTLMVSSTILLTGSKLMNRFHGDGAGKGMLMTSNIFGSIGSIAVCLFLLANFAIILNHRDQYLKLLVKFGGIAAAIYAAFAFAILRYANGIGYQLMGNYWTGADMMQALLKWWLSSKLYLNVFIDLLIVSLLFYFINYRPSKVFVGKKIYIFRLFTIFPILYEVAAMILRGLDATGTIYLPILVMPLFPTKPLLMLLCFLFLILYIKHRERHYVKRGVALKDFNEYLKTNKSSLFFSIQVSVAFLITAIIDIIALAFFIVFYEAGSYEAYFYAVSWGIGNSIPLLLAIPIVMLFSYNRKYDAKNRYDMLIVLGGIAIVALGAIESIYQVICHLI